MLSVRGISAPRSSNPESKGHGLCEIAGATTCVCVCGGGGSACVSHCVALTHETPYVSTQFTQEQMRRPLSQSAHKRRLSRSSRVWVDAAKARKDRDVVKETYVGHPLTMSTQYEKK